MATKRTVGLCLTRLTAAFRRRPPARAEAELELEAWHEALEDLDDTAVLAAARRAVRQCRQMPVPAEIRALAAEEAAGDTERRVALPPPSDLDRALDDALRFMPPWVSLSLDYPTDRNGGMPWAQVLDRREILRAIALAWQAQVPPASGRGLPEDWRGRAHFGQQLAEALVAAVAAHDLGMIRPGGELCPTWRDVRPGWWSHEGLRRVVEQLERGELHGGLRSYALAQLRAHLDAGRMPADVADRARALVEAATAPRNPPVAPEDLARARRATGEPDPRSLRPVGELATAWA